LSHHPDRGIRTARTGKVDCLAAGATGCDPATVMTDRDRPRTWGWLVGVVALDVLVVVGGLLTAEHLVTDDGWAGRRTMYLVMAAVLLVTAVYTTWRSRRTDWSRRRDR
jgi:peptidoglycan/LPS O-acetylase OafA/YrhL